MLVIPLSTVGYTRYARVSHSRQWYNYNVHFHSGKDLMRKWSKYSFRHRQWRTQRCSLWGE